MPPNDASKSIGSSQISTEDLAANPTTTTADRGETATAPSPAENPHEGQVPPPPEGAHGFGTLQHQFKAERGVGIDGEEVIWEDRYSLKNFLGRFSSMAVLTVGWVALALYAWTYRTPTTFWNTITIIAGVVLGVLWLALLYRVLMAHYGHFYRLTNRRLFVMIGVFFRRRDQMELLKINDLYVQQTFFQRWLDIGTIVVESSEENYPISYLTGVNNPKYVMDLIWHRARVEREGRGVQVDTL